MNGQFDTLAVPGKALYSSIDIDMQEYGEKLMKGKKGAIVAIDPQTGEILCLVSSPGYDPNLLVGGKERSRNFTKLYYDSLNLPLFNRALMAMYPTYKDDEIDVMAQITTQKEIDAYNRAAGNDKK